MICSFLIESSNIPDTDAAAADESAFDEEKAAPKSSPSSSVSTPTFFRSRFFWDFVRFLDGERLRSLVADWSLSLASETCLSSPNLKPVLAAFEVLGDAGAVDLGFESISVVIGAVLVMTREQIECQVLGEESEGGKTSVEPFSMGSNSHSLPRPLS